MQTHQLSTGRFFLYAACHAFHGAFGTTAARYARASSCAEEVLRTTAFWELLGIVAGVAERSGRLSLGTKKGRVAFRRPPDMRVSK